MKNVDERIFIVDCKTGEVFQEIDPNVASPVTISYIISDYLESDLVHNKHGLIIKYGLRTC